MGAPFIPVRDAQNNIVGMRPAGSPLPSLDAIYDDTRQALHVSAAASTSTPSTDGALPPVLGTPPAPVSGDPPARPPLIRLQFAGAAIAGLALAAVLFALVVRPAPDVPARALAAPTAVPTLAPTATPFGAPLDVALVAYFDYRDLSSATALEPGRRVEPVARVGHAWLQLQLQDSSRIWVRWRDLPSPSVELLDQLPDLAPSPTPAPTIAPTTAPAPTAAPVFAPPAPCTEATAQYRSAQDVRPYGRVVGISCVSQAEADANAAALAAQMRATGEATR